MDKLVDEVKLWNTPIVGAYQLWRFSHGFCNGHPNGEAPIGLLHFVASAILTNEELCEPITRRRANLQSYVRSFEDKKNSDILMTVHQRVAEKQNYTWAAIDIAVAAGLLFWDTDNGRLYPRTLPNSASRGKTLDKSVIQGGNRAEILGEWFAEHNLATIGSYLKVVF